MSRFFPAVILSLAWCCSSIEVHADLLHDLTTQRHWIGYAPRNFNPNIGQEPSQAQIRDDLEQLFAEGWRSIYTYTLDGVIQHVPRIAKEVGFEYTLAGVFWFDNAQLAREKANAQTQLAHIDGFIVGNEGVAFGRYTKAQLQQELPFFEAFGKPVTTTEVSGLYTFDNDFLDMGDFVFYNTQPWFDPGIDPSDPASVAELVKNEHFFLRGLRPDRDIIIKETWWPTDGHPQANEANQVAFFQALHDETDANGDSVLFAWGEAYDQPWKNENSPFGTLGPDWGFHTTGGTPKQLISSLQSVYTGPVPSAVTTGDYNGDGVVNAADYTLWGDQLGSSGAPYEFAADGDDGTGTGIPDGDVTLADYEYWVSQFGTVVGTGAAAAVPEPGAGPLVLIATICGAWRIRFCTNG